jgi:hypothetical protein
MEIRIASRVRTAGGCIILSRLTVWRPDDSGRISSVATAQSVERWGIFEISLKGPAEGNPFVDIELSATFACADRSITATGFYDGGGIYRVRFMPETIADWRYETKSNRKELNAQSGSFACVAPAKGNHGPVRVHNTFHFAYADGTPYRQIGTTCYVWTHQGEELENVTLETLEHAPFNKMRMCVFPKHYAYNLNEPPRYPFEKKEGRGWNFERFNPSFFQHFEKRVGQLRDMNIEADVILFHPYDEGHWGFDRMSEETDDRYLKYVVARLAAYRNVWWSVANEYDFMKEKKPADWDRYFKIVQASDPYNHLRSIHNGRLIYDHNQPWVTHASIQNGSAVEDFGRAILYRDVYRKPIVFDEVKYEGDIPQRWGDLSAEEMVHRFWQGTIAGTYVGHGETYLNKEEIIWWSKGGALHGQSPPRLAFLRKVMEEGPAEGLEPIDKWQDVKTVGKAGEFYIVYFGHEQPTEWTFELPRANLTAGMKFAAEVLDTWNMTVTPVDETFEIITDAMYRYHAKGLPKIKLPGNKFMAVRIKRHASDTTQHRGDAKIYGE